MTGQAQMWRPPEPEAEPMPPDAIAVAVGGWERDELERIWAEFAARYELRDCPASIECASGGVCVMRFPHGLDEYGFCFLINYLHYPVGFDLKRRRLAVIGRMRVPGSAESPAVDRRKGWATLYVPADDRDRDLIFIRTAAGDRFRMSFTDMAWRPTSDARLRAEDAELERVAGDFF